MNEVKLFRLCGSAPVIDMRTGHNATLRPGLVVMSEDSHTHAIAALEAECERLADELDRESGITGDYIARCQRLAAELEGANERARILLDAKNHWAERARKAEAELAAINGQEVDGGN